jgi:hypothetical protein
MPAVAEKMNLGNAKQRIVHEFKEFLIVVLFVTPFILSFATFRLYVSPRPESTLFVYVTALVNALVLSKVILIGELANLGKSSEHKPLIVPTVHKAAVFALLYVAFHAVEIGTRGVLHGERFFGALYQEVVTHRGEFVTIALIMFFGFIPFFALRETRRVMGPDKFQSLFVGGEQASVVRENLSRHAL